MNSQSTITPNNVDNIAENAINSFIKGELFLKTIRQAVREGVQKEIGLIMGRLDAHEARIMVLENKVDSLSKNIDHFHKDLERKQNKVETLTRELNAQEQYSRRNCLRFYGVPESTNENTDDLIREIVNDKLKIPINNGDIERSHRISFKKKEGAYAQEGVKTRSSTRTATPNPKDSKDPSPRPIIVKFVSYRMRRSIILNRRELKGKKLGIDEDLTKANAALLRKTKDCAKVLSAWTSDGRVIALLPASGGKTTKKLITCEEDLDLI